MASLNEIHEWLALWDKTISTVSIPGSLTGAPLDNPSDPEVTETACYSRLAESFMVEKYKSDEEYWAQYDVQPSWTYFGAHNGLFRKIPAVHEEVCGDFDPRRRPWFVAASSGPKDVVLVLDVSGSMADYGRIDTAKAAAITIVETLAVADRFSVISFSSEASQVGGYPGLIRATNENKNHLVEAIQGLEPQGGTNFYSAFGKAFDVLDGTIRNEATSGCNIAILFMTDGQISVGPEADEVISLVNERTEQLEAGFSRKTTILTFSLGLEADHTVTKTIACSTGGIWTPVYDSYGDLISAMSSYYKLFALGLGEGGNEGFVAWVEPYADYTTGKMGTTVSAPVYDRSVNPPLFLGVVAIDSEMAAIEQVLGEDSTSSTMLERFVARSTARCPKIELSECELDALRFLGGGKDATCGGVCNSTSYAGIVPGTCSFQSDMPNDLWDNLESKWGEDFVILIALDLTEETDKTYLNTAVAGKEYKERACCESGKTLPSGSCPAVHSSPTIEVPSITVGEIIGYAVLGAVGVILCCIIFSCKEKKKKQESSEHVHDQVSVPVQAGNHIHETARDKTNIKNSWENVSMVQPPGASAPPAPVNPLFQASATPVAVCDSQKHTSPMLGWLSGGGGDVSTCGGGGGGDWGGGGGGDSGGGGGGGCSGGGGGCSDGGGGCG